MIEGKPAKAVAAVILGQPMCDMVRSITVRPPTEGENARLNCSGLTLGDVLIFEMDGPEMAPRQFKVTS